jgi:hypothetical protein
METFDFLRGMTVATPLGPVEISLAAHDDGSVSAVAWLLPVGRRVGHLHGQADRSPDAATVEPALAGSGVTEAMHVLVQRALGMTLPTEPVGRRLVRAGLLTESDVNDLLGWQWLLDEIGVHRCLGELALEAGLPVAATIAVTGGPVMRREPGPRRQQPPVMASPESEVVPAVA